MSFASIEGVIDRYFDALHLADAGLMQQVMHPSAVYATADEAEPLFRTAPEYFAVLRGRQSPASRGEARTDRILAIESIGNSTATAKVTCSIGERQFTDVLSLLLIEGEWRIVAKVFAIEFTNKE